MKIIISLLILTSSISIYAQPAYQDIPSRLKKLPALENSRCQSASEAAELFAFIVRPADKMAAPLQMGGLKCQDALATCKANHRLNNTESYRCYWGNYKIYDSVAIPTK